MNHTLAALQTKIIADVCELERWGLAELGSAQHLMHASNQEENLEAAAFYFYLHLQEIKGDYRVRGSNASWKIAIEQCI